MCWYGRVVRALDSRPGGATDPSSNPIRNILLLFLFVLDDYNYFYLSRIPLKKIDNIRREYKPEDVFRPKVATYLQLPEVPAIVYYINWLVF